MNPPEAASREVAVLIPCYNEGLTIGDCVRAFRVALPQATIYVYDNNSTDETVARARDAGAVVREEPAQGKGNVVRRMFADIEADVYVLVDGDSTYDAAAAAALLWAVAEDGLDMVVARRIAPQMEAYRPGHQFGNVFLTFMLRAIFGNVFRDVLSGYRAFSRRFVKSFPALATGFEIEVDSPSTRSACDCQYARSTLPMPRVRKVRSASSIPGATASAFCG